MTIAYMIRGLIFFDKIIDKTQERQNVQKARSTVIYNYIIRLNDDNISTMNFRWNKSAEYKS